MPTKYIKRKDGKFAGSIGDGKTTLPQQPPQRPRSAAQDEVKTHTTGMSEELAAKVDAFVAANPIPRTTLEGLSPRKHHFPFAPVQSTSSGVYEQPAEDNPLVQHVQRHVWARPCSRKIVNAETKEVIWRCGNTTPHMRSMNPSSSAYCYDCQGFDKVLANSKEHGFEMTISRQEYTEWRKNQERKCYYCGIDERDVHKLEVRGSQGTKPFVESLGTDRWDSSRGYDMDNIVLACQACNQMKSEVHGDDFMQVIDREGLRAIRRKKVQSYRSEHKYCCPED